MNQDTAPDYPPRVIRLNWTAGEPLVVDFDGVWDDWEVRAALTEALAQYDLSDETIEPEP